jgi:hypothetical protein
MATALGIVLLAVCLCLGYLAFRRVRLMRGGGVDLSLRRRPANVRRDASVGWHAGVARYRGDRLDWYRLTSLRPGASLALDRTELQILDRRIPDGAESYVMPAAASVLRLRSRGVDVELAMSAGVLTGFLAWLEATPPGRSTGYRQAS